MSYLPEFIFENSNPLHEHFSKASNLKLQCKHNKTQLNSYAILFSKASILKLQRKHNKTQLNSYAILFLFQK